MKISFYFMKHWLAQISQAIGLRVSRQLHPHGHKVLKMSGGAGSCTGVFVYVQVHHALPHDNYLHTFDIALIKLLLQCKPGTEDDFKSASLTNAQNSVQEVRIACDFSWHYLACT